VKFTAEGEVVVKVTLDKHESRGTLHFSVNDTGIGIPQAKQDRLFKSFSQVDSSTTRQYGGTGLGLAISKRLTEAMGGRMWVESEAGHGSTFYFTIDIKLPDGGSPATWEAIRPDLVGRRILVQILRCSWRDGQKLETRWSRQSGS
jgi:signal transduction histidine kinase